MSNFFKSKFFIILAIVTVLILILMAVSTISTDKAGFAGDAVGTVMSPVQRFFRSVGDATGNFFSRFRSNSSYREENQQLAARVKELEEETRELYALRNENERLRGLLSLSETYTNYEMVGARVVAKDPGAWFSAFKIDKGTVHGVRKNDTVITDAGLVGYVYEVGSTWSNVVSVIDSRSAAGCIIERTGDMAVVEGSLDLMNEGTCHLSYLSREAEVAVGDFVETSGLGGIYPEKLLIGKIKSLSVDPQGLYYEAVIEPAVDFERITEVMVIRRQEE
ncbi:MAG: rod shape-determining protein MreC [Ruminococcaceae bacterium]|nr:rod shape-determining protein MreC [Oscillospiraceae bacterium]